jgi:hypothetical protein
MSGTRWEPFRGMALPGNRPPEASRDDMPTIASGETRYASGKAVRGEWPGPAHRSLGFIARRVRATCSGTCGDRRRGQALPDLGIAGR